MHTLKRPHDNKFLSFGLFKSSKALGICVTGQNEFLGWKKKIFQKEEKFNLA